MQTEPVENNYHYILDVLSTQFRNIIYVLITSYQNFAYLIPDSGKRKKNINLSDITFKLLTVILHKAHTLNKSSFENLRNINPLLNLY